MALVPVPAADRPQALIRYRLWLAGNTVRHVMDTIRDELVPVFREISSAVRHVIDSIRRMFGRSFASGGRSAACTYFGVRRVTARQYRTYRRRLHRLAL